MSFSLNLCLKRFSTSSIKQHKKTWHWFLRPLNSQRSLSCYVSKRQTTTFAGSDRHKSPSISSSILTQVSTWYLQPQQLQYLRRLLLSAMYTTFQSWLTFLCRCRGRSNQTHQADDDGSPCRFTQHGCLIPFRNTTLLVINFAILGENSSHEGICFNKNRCLSDMKVNWFENTTWTGREVVVCPIVGGSIDHAWLLLLQSRCANLRCALCVRRCKSNGEVHYETVIAVGIFFFGFLPAFISCCQEHNYCRYNEKFLGLLYYFL